MMDDPPAQDSPKNILNILNDDSIEAILRRLKNQGDLLNAANTCKRFMESAKHLRSMFRSVVIADHSCSETVSSIVSADDAPMLLSNFGHLIESVEWKPKSGKDLNDEMFALIIRFCGKTLKRLVIENYNPTLDKPNQLPALTDLELYDASPINFDLDSPLRKLRIESRTLEEQPWFIRHLPYLSFVDLKSQDLTDNMITKFLSLNRKLVLLFVNSNNLSSIVFESIALYAKSILHIHFDGVYFDDDGVNENFMHLGALHRLQGLTISSSDYTPLPLEVVFNSFAESEAPVYYLGPIDVAPENTRRLPTINTLRQLWLRCADGISDELMINLIKTQTFLEQLTIQTENTDDGTLKMQNIMKMLMFGRYLTVLRYLDYAADTEINLETYNAILALARNRVKVKILCGKIVDIPQDTLEANENWLTIILDKDEVATKFA